MKLTLSVGRFRVSLEAVKYRQTASITGEIGAEKIVPIRGLAVRKPDYVTKEQLDATVNQIHTHVARSFERKGRSA